MNRRVYELLLWLYPRQFRTRYGDEMARLFADQLADARAGRGDGVARAWIRALGDVVASAAGEHLRRDQHVAQSLAMFRPTRFMRLLGLIGIVGALLLLAGFVTFEPFERAEVSTLRIAWFGVAGAAISLGFYPRQALAMSRLAFAATAVVGIIGVTYALLTVQAAIVGYARFGLVGIDAALWVSAALYGAALLRIGAAWIGMPNWASAATRLGAALLLGSAVAWIGDDHFHLVDDEVYGGLFLTIAVVGVVMNGVGWLVLGTVLLVGGPRRAEA
jgi:hypothetical protein